MKNFQKIACMGLIAVAIFTACNNSKSDGSGETASTATASGDMDRYCILLIGV